MIKICNKCGSSMSLWCDKEVRQLKARGCPSWMESEKKCLESNDYEQLQAKNQNLQSDVKLWRKRVDEAAKVIETFEELQVENERLRDLLSELYGEVSYEWAGEWVIENRELMKRIKQSLKEKDE